MCIIMLFGVHTSLCMCIRCEACMVQLLYSSSLISIPSSTYILEKPTVIIQILHMIQFKVRNSTLGIYRESNST